MNKKERKQHLTAIYNEVARQVWDEAMTVHRFAGKVRPEKAGLSDEALKQEVEESIRAKVLGMLQVAPAVFNPDSHEDAKKALDAVKNRNDKGVAYGRVYRKFKDKYWEQDFFADPQRTADIFHHCKKSWDELDQLIEKRNEEFRKEFKLRKTTKQEKLEHEFTGKVCDLRIRTGRVTRDVVEKYMKNLCSPS